MTRAGIPERVVAMLIGFSMAQAQGELDLVSEDLSRLIGQKPVSFGDRANAVAGAIGTPSSRIS